MVRATEGNPLALACLASNFTGHDSQGNQDKRAWQDAYSELIILLQNPEDKIVLGHDVHTSRSLWAAMKMCLDSLQTTDAKAILCFLAASKHESLPEEVLRILHKHKKSSSSTFYKSSRELLARELVKDSSRDIAPWVLDAAKTGTEDDAQRMSAMSSTRSTTWSIRSLVKLYMEANAKEVSSVIGALLHDEFAAELSLLGEVVHQGTA